MLFRSFSGPNNTQISIFVSEPSKDESGDDWKCEYWIEGIGSEKRRTSYGVDPIQAMSLALTYLATTLYCSDEFKRGLITWGNDDDRFDLGLPIAQTIREDVEQCVSALRDGSR